MEKIVNENTHPIQLRWVFSPLVGIFGLVLLTFLIIPLIPIVQTGLRYGILSALIAALFTLTTFWGLLGLMLLVIFGTTYLKRKNFHFLFEENYITLNQGILSKQQKHVRYDTIQNVLIIQNLSDKILGISTVLIENMSGGDAIGSINNSYAATQVARDNSHSLDNAYDVGFVGNRVFIPGLKKQDAESLKQLVLQKMKENPTHDSGSGL